jgi:hypothetical protein
VKKLLLLACAVWFGVFGWSRLRDGGAPEPLYDRPYVVVYGRDSCGLTRAMQQELARTGVPFDYQVIDLPATSDLVHARMRQSGLETRSYRLPVVDVSGTLLVSPSPTAVAEVWRHSRSASALQKR